MVYRTISSPKDTMLNLNARKYVWIFVQIRVVLLYTLLSISFHSRCYNDNSEMIVEMCCLKYLRNFNVKLHKHGNVYDTLKEHYISRYFNIQNCKLFFFTQRITLHPWHCIHLIIFQVSISTLIYRESWTLPYVYIYTEAFIKSTSNVKIKLFNAHFFYSPCYVANSLRVPLTHIYKTHQIYE